MRKDYHREVKKEKIMMEIVTTKCCTEHNSTASGKSSLRWVFLSAKSFIRAKLHNK